MKWIIATICLGIIGFCVFGFLATFEVGVSNALAFRVGYLVIAIACLVGMVRLMTSKHT